MWRLAVGIILFVPLWAGVCAANSATAALAPRDAIWLQTASSLQEWQNEGTRDAVQGAFLAARSGRRAPCSRSDIDGGRAWRDSRAHVCRGTDPYPPHRYGQHLDYYNGGSFLFGVMRSPTHMLPADATQLIVSWDADTPPGTWIETHVEVREQGTWTHPFDLPIWSSGGGTITRHSVGHQRDAAGAVQTDTFVAPSGRPFDAIRLNITLFSTSLHASPTVRLVAVTTSSGPGNSVSSALTRGNPAMDLPVPRRSQMMPAYRAEGFGGGGETWCSPTSTSMVMAYWGNVLHRPSLRLPVPRVAAGVYDATYQGAGNWPFNTSYAASVGLIAYVERFPSFAAVERFIADRIPIVISIAFGRGELPGEPVGQSDGHLLVVRGFTRAGDVITNDPAAATNAGVRIVYPRAALERAWQHGSDGTSYIIYPPSWKTPGAIEPARISAGARGARLTGPRRPEPSARAFQTRASLWPRAVPGPR